MNDENIPSGNQAVSHIDGKKIRSIRERKELTQLYVATVVGVTTDTISRWENRRYPTIKQENALKLAEVLDVDLVDILDNEIIESSSSNDEVLATGKVVKNGGKKATFVITIAFITLAIILALILVLKPLKVNEAASLIVTAHRILPAHVAPGQPFPVIINVDISPVGNYSMIVREIVPIDCLIVKGLPSFANLDPQKGILKWIGKTTNKTSFSYLARTNTSIIAKQQLLFKGIATLKNGDESTQIAIQGDDSVTLENLHWADRNGDYRIDDEEILAIYDQLEAMTELGAGDFQSKVEDIWAASGYRWDETTGTFVIVP